jgi:hypothetical protein
MGAKPDPTVTDHAMIRYIERVMGIDMEALKARILTPETRAFIDQFGSGKFPVAPGYRLVVKNRVVITVEPL